MNSEIKTNQINFQFILVNKFCLIVFSSIDCQSYIGSYNLGNQHLRFIVHWFDLIANILTDIIEANLKTLLSISSIF